MDKKPVFKYRVGACSATVWPNTIKTEKGEYESFNVVLDRSYKTGDEWKNTNSFNAQDLPKIKLCIDKAYEYVTQKKVDDND